MVYYRKYRPQKIAELDSEELRQKLYSVFSDLSSIPHAFLFTGPKGLGKTSTARIIAKVVNCEKRSALYKEQKTKNKEQKGGKILSSKFTVQSSEGIEPCNECSQCISITNGNNLDILEIDGASNRGIDEIRDLREKVRLAPVSAHKKVYIIDEVHMLTTEAFNALLKTLEEPPPHVMFMFCTTEPHKVPDTILSRCFHISFKLATANELLSSFKRIKDSEGLDIEDEALSFIAELSDGSFRDGAKILDEMVSISSGKKITKELIEEKYKVSSIKYQVLSMIGFLEKKDTKGSLELISELVKTGIDMKFFIEKLVGELHTLLLMKVGVAEFSVVPRIVPSSSASDIVSSSSFEINEIKKLMELLTKANGELKYAVLPQLPLEIAVIEWGMQQTQNQTELKTQNKTEVPFRVVPRIVSSSSVLDTSVKQNDNGIWQKFIDEVKTHNHSLAGVLRGCFLKSSNDEEFVIETAYQFHKDKLSDKKAMEILEKVVVEIVGKPVKVGVVLMEK